MASLSYLWRNRARFEFGSRPFLRAWGKRLQTLPEVLRRNRIRKKLVGGGAVVADTAEIGPASIEGKKGNFCIGEHSFVGRAHIALHGRVDIGRRVCINDGVQILTASHDVSDPQWRHQVKPVKIGDFVWIGTAAIILPGVELGDRCVVGAGAVVSKSVAPGDIVAGNPARPLSKKRCEVCDYNPCEFLAGNRAWLVG